MFVVQTVYCNSSVFMSPRRTPVRPSAGHTADQVEILGVSACLWHPEVTLFPKGLVLKSHVGGRKRSLPGCNAVAPRVGYSSFV